MAVLSGGAAAMCGAAGDRVGWLAGACNWVRGAGWRPWRCMRVGMLQACEKRSRPANGFTPATDSLAPRADSFTPGARALTIEQLDFHQHLWNKGQQVASQQHQAGRAVPADSQGQQRPRWQQEGNQTGCLQVGEEAGGQLRHAAGVQPGRKDGWVVGWVKSGGREGAGLRVAPRLTTRQHGRGCDLLRRPGWQQEGAATPALL